MIESRLNKKSSSPSKGNKVISKSSSYLDSSLNHSKSQKSKEGNNKLKMISKNSHSDSQRMQKTYKNFKSEESLVEKAFELHRKDELDINETIFSLKYLGITLRSEHQYDQLLQLWREIKNLTVNLEQFGYIYQKLQSRKQQSQNTFNFLCEQNYFVGITKQSLLNIVKDFGLKFSESDLGNILEYCGKSGSISYQQFQNICKIANTFN